MIGRSALVAGLVRRELARHPGAWRLPLVSTVLFSVLFIGIGVVGANLEERASVRSFAMAVEGDTVGASDFLVALSERRLAPRPLVDAQHAVEEREASIGLLVPDGVDEAYEAGESIQITLLAREEENSTREAQAHLRARLAEMELEQLGVSPAPVRIERVETQRVEDLNRVDFAGSLAAMLCFLSLGAITAVASILGGARDQRASEVLLVLPLPRSSIALGTAAGAYIQVLVQLLAGLAVFSLVAMAPLPSLDLSAATVASLLPGAIVGAALLAVLATATGVLAGSLGGGSDEAVGFGDLLAVPFVGFALLLFLSPGLDLPTASGAIPLLGTVLLVRDAALGELSWIGSPLAAASTLATAALLLLVASWALGRPRRILRA